MTVQTNKKGPNNRGDEELNRRLRSKWLGVRDSNLGYYHLL